jgi:low temperature requirement protein LtrA
VSSGASSHLPRLTAVLRYGEQVTSLELFFDLVFVLALTQCTALMAHTPTWEGALKGLLVLGVLWWSWAGYAWLTSVVDPEEGSVRLVMFAAMAAPFLFGADGWKLVPGHFAERHGAIIIIALGESIVAIGAGATAGMDAGVVLAAVLGIVVAGAMWWMYFDVVAVVAVRRLAKAAAGRERNDIARDSYSYLHFPMVAGIALVAVGLKKKLGHVDDPLGLVPAAAMLGGGALYLLAHVAFRWRNIHTLNRQRLLCAALLIALLLGEVALKPPSLVTLGTLAVLLSALIAYEAVRFADTRERIRHQLARQEVAS